MARVSRLAHDHQAGHGCGDHGRHGRRVQSRREFTGLLCLFQALLQTRPQAVDGLCQRVGRAGIELPAFQDRQHHQTITGMIFVEMYIERTVQQARDAFAYVRRIVHGLDQR